jgi:hypothetical protein
MGESKLSLYLGRLGVDYWFPIIIGKQGKIKGI